MSWFACAPRKHVWQAIDAQSYTVTAQATDSLENAIAPYREQIQNEMNIEIALVLKPLTKETPESSLGNWMADVTALYASEVLHIDVDLSIMNKGGIRIQEIPKGPLSIGKIYELMPFDNRLVVMTLDYATLHTFLQATIDQGGWPISKDWQIVAKSGKIVDIYYQGQAIDRESRYKVLMNDYIANGGSNCSFLSSIDYQDTDVLYRDALIEGAKIQQEQDGGIASKIENRIVLQ